MSRSALARRAARATCVSIVAAWTIVGMAVAVAAPAVDKVKVDKLGRRLYLMLGGEVVRSFPVALGGNPVGHKQQEGDRRTPEGRYVLDFRKADSAYHRALHISYPDANDSDSARIRGVPRAVLS